MSKLWDDPAAVTSRALNKEMCMLSNAGFVRTRRIGMSVCKRSILAVEIGAMHNPVVFVGGTHGMEWASVLATFRLASEIVAAVETGKTVHGIDMREALALRGAVFIPLLNPDGYEIRREGRCAALKKTKLLSQFEDTTLEMWQSNANGVDLNHNFNAGFYKAYRQVRGAGIKKPGPTRYGGLLPFSQPETRAARMLCAQCRPRALYALHSQGEEIYWRYGKRQPAGSEYIATLLSNLTGYALCEPEELASHAGLKDWFIQRYNCPGFTLELGAGQNPLPYEDFDAIWQRVERALFVAALI